MRLKDKVAIVSGAASGMGQCEAMLFAREGARVVVADVLETEGRQTADKITAGGGQARFVKLDVTSESNWQSTVEAAVSAFGKLDVLVNNAGISGTFDPDMLSTTAWDKLMDVNIEEWRREVISQDELFIKLYGHLPKEIIFQRELLVSRL